MNKSNSLSSKKHKWKITLAKIFNWCFLIAVTLILVCSIGFISQNDNLRYFNHYLVIVGIILAIIIGAFLIYTTFNFFKKKSKKINLIFQKVNWFLIILLAFIIAFTVQVKFEDFDPQYCINTAKELYPTMNWQNVKCGNQFGGYYYALIRNYHMAPFIYLEALVLKFFSLINIKLSFADILALGTYTNMIMLLIAMYLAFRLIKKYCKISTQTGFTFLLLINIPLFTTVYYVYTDIPALLTIMIILNAYDSFIQTKKFNNKIFFIVIIILTSIIGALFKFNVLIALFAIIIHYFLTYNWKHSIKFILILLVPTMLSINAIKHTVSITSPVSQSKLGIPATNWINMSFSKVSINGGYNEESYQHTLKLKKKYHTNSKVAKVEIKELLNGIVHNPKRYLYIIYRKIGATYGIGTYEFNSPFIKKYATHPQMANTIFGQLLYGKYNKLLLYSSFILQLSLFLFMDIGIFFLIRQKCYLSNLTIWMLTLFGNMFVLLFWETRSRYLIAFIGVIYLISCIGIEQLQYRKK